MTTYRQCDHEIRDRAQALIGEHHPDLLEAGVTIDFLFAFATKDEETGIPKGPAIRVGGYACAAVTRVVSLVDRTKGVSDAEILIDGDRWDEWTTRHQDALLDHEIEHLELKMTKGKKPVVVRDAADRPMLRLKKHDHQFGWFDSIAMRWGADSFEVQQATLFANERGQYYFGFAAPPAPTADDVLREARVGARSQKAAAPRTRAAIEAQEGAAP